MTDGELSIDSRASICPVCGAELLASPFLNLDKVPGLLNFPLPDFAAARAVPSGRLSFKACAKCGFLWNTAFDPQVAEYGSSYETARGHSPFYAAFIDETIKDLLDREELTNKVVAEIGCGQGDFLQRLVNWPGGGVRGYGFDPAYRGPEGSEGDNPRFFRAQWGGGEPGFQAEAVIARHLLEHIPAPLDFLKSVRPLLKENGRLYLETPSAEWILAQAALWDFFHEHCSLFTAFALAHAVEEAGFHMTRLERRYGGQYWWLAAEKTPSAAEAGGRFGALEPILREEIQRLLQAQRARGEMVLWGAGAKGVAFANAMDRERKFLKALVDENPAKQGKYIPGSAHLVIPPEALPGLGAATIILLNPVYVEEITARTRALGLKVEIVDLATHIAKFRLSSAPAAALRGFLRSCKPERPRA
jgi:SAM-dependent methyltransferase